MNLIDEHNIYKINKYNILLRRNINLDGTNIADKIHCGHQGRTACKYVLRVGSRPSVRQRGHVGNAPFRDESTARKAAADVMYVCDVTLLQ